MTASKLIKRIRSNLGLSLSDFAKETGLDYSTVYRWENGEHKPTPKLRIRLKIYCREQGVGQYLIDEIDGVDGIVARE
jgi:transcriptional regulator with XRE-family HTH domain